MAGERDATRVAIRRGQRLFRAGKRLQAADVWRASLAGAYASEDFAGLFVLTKNLGETALALALPAVAADAKTSAAGLRDAVRYFTYALGLIDQCGVRDRVEAYDALQASVLRVESRLVEAEKQLREVEARGDEGAAAVEWLGLDAEDSSRQVCTTCERVLEASEVVLDESDGCLYCVECFEEYYASLGASEVSSTNEAVAQVGADGNGDSNSSVDDDDADKDGDELLAAETGEPVLSAATPNQAQDDPTLTADRSSADLSTSEGYSQGTRVELGSLADVLRQELAQVDQAPAHPVVDDAGAKTHDDQVNSNDSSYIDHQTPETEQCDYEPPIYTIPELLKLRGLVSVDACPPGLELLPVHKSHMRSSQPAKALGSNSKSSSALKPIRFQSSVAKPTSEPKRSSASSSTHPSLELIESLRETNRSDSSGRSAVEALATKLFGVSVASSVV